MDARIRNKRVLIFDLDGVVIITTNHWKTSTLQFLENHGVTNPDIREVMHRCTGLSLKEGAIEMQKMFGFSGNPLNLVIERRELIGHLYRHKTIFHRGFLEYLTRVRTQYGWRVCIATSCDPYLLDLVDEALSIRRLFLDKVYDISQVDGRSKPDPAIFEYAAIQMGVKPSSCFVIEDSPNGIKAAKSAGMTCVGLIGTTSGTMLQSAGADILIRGFGDKAINS